MVAIWKKEMGVLFRSVIGWLFVAALMLFLSIYFSAYNLMYGYSSLASTMASSVLISLIAIPILSMRILSEERKQKTDQLILTSPLSVGKIVAGKYLALLTTFAIPVFAVCTYPLILGAFGEVRYGESYSAILGFFLYGAACIAIGVFISSLTESQVIAAVLTFAVLLLTYIMQGIISLISTDGNVVTHILEQLDLYQRFYSFLQGTLSITSIVYFVSVTLLFLFLTTQSIQKRRYSVSVKTFTMGAFSSTMIAAALVLTVLVNLIAANLPAKYASIDVTKEKLYAISDDTKKVAEALSEDITIYVLNAKDSQDETVGRTLEGYEELSSHIKVEYKDPVKYPNFYTQYTQESVTRNSLIVVGEKRSQVISYNDLYETEFDYTSYSQTTTGYDAEGQITSAIAFVTSDSIPKVYILEGHDEMALDASFASALAKENIETESISLLQYDSIPEDAEAIMI
ncbi:MAG: Gldg family protein, partial [Lachnospiraceae bacterium]|nr:Gldg family protein [Lachnospiraceae bacterium]